MNRYRAIRMTCIFVLAIISLGWQPTARADAEPVVKIAAKRFTFSPSVIHLKKGETVILELTSLDRTHGFEAPDLGLTATIKPGAPTRIKVTPTKAGSFSFHCNVFCGDGHEDMNGTIVVS
jgi:cytochrome c oxidase subunit 2